MALNRNDLVRPALPRETVAMPALGGDVIVRGLLLGERAVQHRDRWLLAIRQVGFR
jgi:hypothetical protein